MKFFARSTASAPHEESSTARPPEKSLEAVLMELQKFGKPRLGVFSRGWVCTLELAVSSIGFEAEVRSEFTHAVPIDAALQCRDRLRAQLQQLRDL